MWLGIGAGALCASAVLIGYLARPGDPYATIRRFHPAESWERPCIAFSGETCHVFRFRSSYDEVRSAIPVRHNPALDAMNSDVFELPSGKIARFDFSDQTEGGYRCQLTVAEEEPFLIRIWHEVGRRLGF